MITNIDADHQQNPAAAASPWQTLTDPLSGGREYYFNHDTGMTQWEQLVELDADKHDNHHKAVLAVGNEHEKEPVPGDWSNYNNTSKMSCEALS